MTASYILAETPKLETANLIKSVEMLRNRFHEALEDENLIEIFFIQNGRGELTIGKQVISFSEGDLIVRPFHSELMEVRHISPVFKGFSLVISNLHIQGKPKNAFDLPGTTPILNLQRHYKSIEKYFIEIVNEFQDPQMGSTELISSLLQTVIILIHRNAHQVHIPEENTSMIHYVKGYIEENYNQELSLNELAGLVFVSPYHLAHSFKEVTGTAPIQYLIKCRIDEAKRLLAYTDLTVREIALAVGYPNANYFNLLFKKITGEAPGKYRRNI